MSKNLKQTEDFFDKISVQNLIKEYGSPLYVYKESIIIENCKKMKSISSYKNFDVHYSAKANSNLAILQIIKNQGLNIDAMSIGEIYSELLAGFLPNQIMFVSNNIPIDDMKFAVHKGIIVALDSISQLYKYAENFMGTNVVIRFNPGFGDGHHKQTITAGEYTKFGIEITEKNIKEINEICKKYNIKIVGLHMHIGSLFLDIVNFLESGNNILKIAKYFEDLEFIDLGGGFGIPYKKQDGETPLNFEYTSKKIDEFIQNFIADYGKELKFKIEPGRFIVAEAGVLLGTVISKKENYGKSYIGTDIGFNSFIRPVLYDAHHDISVFRDNILQREYIEKVTIVGNVCENGDSIAVDRNMPKINEGDILAIMDTGAYGHVMSSNYNNMLRPAEILIRTDETTQIIRKRDTLESLVQFQKTLNE
ncbi:MAG: diaminopimelate decarboxylase [Defluviitaleaceae bacterium]|nr:diaminopimelate decarboxylase [Defluviitaleaceae bacterium]